MTRTLIIEPEAIADLENAKRWYNDQQFGLGTQFLDDLEEAFRFIAQHAENLPITYRDLRLNRVRRFPYIVVYRVQAERVFVLAICHTHRDPATWQARGSQR